MVPDDLRFYLAENAVAVVGVFFAFFAIYSFGMAVHMWLAPRWAERRKRRRSLPRTEDDR